NVHERPRLALDPAWHVELFPVHVDHHADAIPGDGARDEVGPRGSPRAPRVLGAFGVVHGSGLLDLVGGEPAAFEEHARVVPATHPAAARVCMVTGRV